MRDFQLKIRGISDMAIRDNFQDIQEWVQEHIFEHFTGRHFEIEITKAETNLKYPHNLRYQPKDIIQTYLTGAGSLTWNYDEFDNENLDITTTGACTVRAFIGRFEED